MTSSYELRRKAEDLLRGKYTTAIVYALVLFGLNAFMGAFVPKIGPGETLTAAESGLSFIVNVATFVIEAGLAYGAVLLWRAYVLGTTPNLDQVLFAGFRNDFGRNLVLALLIAIFTFLWTLLLIIPGIVKAYAYSMSYYLLHREPGLDAAAAIDRSQVVTRGSKGRLFMLDLSYIGWYFLGIFTLGILWLWVVPRHQVARMLLYEEIYAPFAPAAAEAQPAL